MKWRCHFCHEENKDRVLTDDEIARQSKYIAPGTPLCCPDHYREQVKWIERRMERLGLPRSEMYGRID